MFNSSKLLTAAKMAKQQGLTKVLQQNDIRNRAMAFVGDNGAVLVMPMTKNTDFNVLDASNGEVVFDISALSALKIPATLKGIKTARETLEALLPNLNRQTIESLIDSEEIRLVDGKVVYTFPKSDIVKVKEKAKDPNTYNALENIENNGLVVPMSKEDIANIFAENEEDDGILSRRESYKEIPSEEYAVLSSNLSQRFGHKNIYGCVGYTSNYFYLCDYIDGETLVRTVFEIDADESTRQYIENYARRRDRFTEESFIAGLDSSRVGVSGEIWDFNGSQDEGTSVGDGMVDSPELREETESERDNGSVSEDNWITVKTGYDGSKFARIRFIDESELDYFSRRSDIQNSAVDYLVGEPRNRAIERAVNEEASKLGVTVTYKTREEMPRGHKNDKGYYNTNTGEIVVCTENNASINDAIQTILHEAVAHKGLRQLMGDRFDEFINRVYESLDDDTKAKVDKLANDTYEGNAAVAMEEYMASLAEKEDFAKASVWEKIKNIFNDIINKLLGRDDIKIGDNELRYILRASYANMVNPRNMETIEGWAKDTRMREEYKINEATPEILSRTGIDPTIVATETARQTYDRVVRNSWQEFERQFQDDKQPVRIAIDAIQQETGNVPIEDYENYILISNQASSRSRIEIDNFARKYYSTIIDKTNRIIDKILEKRHFNIKDEAKRAEVYAEIRQYLIAKHGLERNAYYQAKNTKIVDGEDVPDIRDYSGLTALFGMEPKQFKEA